jgi:hypothetical protein
VIKTKITFIIKQPPYRGMQTADVRRFSSTLYIKHLAGCANYEAITFNKHCNGLIGNRFEMPNVSYTCPLD